MRRMRSPCCARAVTGHAAAAPPSATNNSRRPMTTAIRPLPCEVRKDNDIMPRACCPITARLAPRGRPPKNGAIDHPQPGADKVDSTEGIATLEAMSSHHNFPPGQQNKLVSEPPIAAPDEHALLVEADQRFRAALGQAIAAGGERIEAVEATVQLKRRTKLPR